MASPTTEPAPGNPAGGPAAPDRTRETLAIAALAVAAFALNLNTNVLGALLPFLGAEFALDAERDKLLVAGAGFGSAFGALLLGPAAQRAGRRSVLVLGLVLFAAASLGHVAVNSFLALLVARTAAGLGVGLAYAAASALVAEVAPYARRGRAMGLFNAGMFLAIPVGLPLSVWLARSGAWRTIFVVQALLGVAGIVLALRTLPNRRVPQPMAAMWQALWAPGVAATLLATMLHVGSFFTAVQLATRWLDETNRLAKEQQMPLWIALGTASVLGSALLARFADRIGKRSFVLLTSAVLVGCFGVLAQGPGNVTLVACAAVLALTAAARTGPLQALLSGLVPGERLAPLMAMRGFTMQLGVGLFALAAAPVAAMGGFEAVLLLGAGCQFASYVVIRFGVREAQAPR